MSPRVKPWKRANPCVFTGMVAPGVAKALCFCGFGPRSGKAVGKKHETVARIPLKLRAGARAGFTRQLQLPLAPPKRRPNVNQGNQSSSKRRELFCGTDFNLEAALNIFWYVLWGSSCVPRSCFDFAPEVVDTFADARDRDILNLADEMEQDMKADKRPFYLPVGVWVFSTRFWWFIT